MPATTNPLGVKGGSECGSAGIPAALCNAIQHALREAGVDEAAVGELRLPATAERVWRVLNAHR